MKIVITEEQEKNLRLYKIYELVKPYFEEKGFNNLKKVVKSNMVRYIGKDNYVIFYYKQDRGSDNVYIDYDLLWKFFESYFSLEYIEIQEVIGFWLDEVYRISGLTPNSRFSSS